MSSPERKVLLNPGPATTTDTVKYAQIVSDICPREKEFADLLLSVCDRLVSLVGSTNAYCCVPFTASGTGAVEACVSSVVPNEKKLLVVINGAYGRRIAQIGKTYLGERHVLSMTIAETERPDLDAVETLLKANPDISHVAIVHHETTTGMLNPLDELLELVHRHDARLIVDAMSSFAGIPFDLNQLPIDFLISSSNKCIQGMAGISFVIGNSEQVRASANVPARSLYFNLAEQRAYLERSGQLRYTPPVQIVYALDQAIREYLDETPAGRWARYQANWQVVWDGMQELGFRPLLPEAYQSKILTAFHDPTSSAYDFNAMHNYLYERGYTIYPGKCAEIPSFRIANMGQIFPDDLKAFLSVLSDYLRQSGVTLP